MSTDVQTPFLGTPLVPLEYKAERMSVPGNDLKGVFHVRNEQHAAGLVKAPAYALYSIIITIYYTILYYAILYYIILYYYSSNNNNYYYFIH